MPFFPPFLFKSALGNWSVVFQSVAGALARWRVVAHGGRAMEGRQTRDVVALLLAEIEREEASGFALLASLPSGTTARHLSLFGQLSAEERRQVKHAIARTRATWFGAPEDRDADAALSAFAVMAFQQRPPPWPHPANVPKARELKKLAALAMAQLLGAKPAATTAPGELEYAGEIDGERVRVRLRHNVRMVQLEYSIHPARLDADPNFQFTGLTYEQLIGFGSGLWDQITLANVDQSFAALTDVVRRTMAVVQAITTVR